MADWYCDPSTISSSDYAGTPTAAGTVPTKAEDGNGKGTGVGAMATLVITFTGIPSAAEAITIAGVTFTARASGATGNEFNAVTDATTCATNLKNAINASTTNAIKPTAEIAATAPLRNIVNATSSAGVVTVYTRIASAAWNSVTETENLTNCTITAQWSGGSDGAWGYFFNPAAIAFPTSVAAGAYGAFPGSYLGIPAAGDIVHIRTKRSGSNITITWANASVTVTSRAIGTNAAALTFLADNGVKWSGDAGVFILSADQSQSVQKGFYVANVNNVRQVLSGVETAADTYNWRWELTGAHAATTWSFTIGCGGGSSDPSMFLENMEFTGAARASMNNANNVESSLKFTSPKGTPAARDLPSLILRNVLVKSAARKSPIYLNDVTYSLSFRLVNFVLDATGLSSVATEAIVWNISGTGVLGRFEAIASRWLGFPAAANVSGFSGVTTGRLQISMRDCITTNIKLSGGTSNGGMVGIATASVPNYGDITSSISVSSSVGNRDHVFENYRKSFAWIDSAAPTTANSTLSNGDRFSIRTAVTPESGEVSKYRPATMPRLTKSNSLADGTRTATLRLLVDNNIRTALGSRDPNNDEMWITVVYVGTDGLPKTVTSKPIIGASVAALTAGTSGDWSATSYDVNGVTHNYTAYEIAVSCPDVETLTELALEFSTGCPGSSVDDLVFLDPEWSLA